jgi:hypothetical protein
MALVAPSERSPTSGSSRCSSSYAVERAAVHPEPAPRQHAHRLGPRGPVERGGDLCPPVDDDRLAVGVGDVPAADVAGRVGAGCVDPPEEQRAGRVVDEGASTLPQGVGKVSAGDPVTGRRLQGQGVLAHPGELVAGVLKIGLLAGELQGRVSGHEEATSGRPGEGGREP